MAYSGGLDSLVLLHAMAQLRLGLSGIELHALHVDHKLQSVSAQWLQHCEAVCAALQIPCRCLTINAQAMPGESPEAAARHARYQAMATVIEAGDCLLTAHHQDDQAETLLLQLLRGAGFHGLAAMPSCIAFGKGLHARPLLAFSRAELREYAERHALAWIEDSSNLNTDFERNYLRQAIMPRLRERWPAMARTLSRSAGHAADAAYLLDVLAERDIHAVQKTQQNTLSVNRLRGLEKARQCNALRAWIRQQDLPLPSTVHIERIISDVILAAHDSTPCVRWPGAELRRYRDDLHIMPPLPAHDVSQVFTWEMHNPLTLADQTQLCAMPTPGAGIKATSTDTPTVTVQFRQGGERCRPVGRHHTHELKKLFQEQAIPPWQRDRIPLIYVDGQLAAVADLWVCDPFHVADDDLGLVIQWQKRHKV